MKGFTKNSQSSNRLIQCLGGLYLVVEVNLGCRPVHPLGEWIRTGFRPDCDLTVVFLLSTFVVRVARLEAESQLHLELRG